MGWKENIETHYPNAKPGVEVSETYIEKLELEFGGDRKSTLFATSLCSDDIRVSSTCFQKAFFGPFTLGGLGGLPFAGMTGMTAFAHHIPDNGTAFILYGPHIGITSDGVLGKMLRPCQTKVTSSCGALMLSLKRFSAEGEDGPYIPLSNEWDYQQTTLEKTLMPFKAEILSSKIPEKAITDATYKVINQQVHHLVETVKPEFDCARVALLGGVTINTDPYEPDWFDTRNFEVIEL